MTDERRDETPAESPETAPTTADPVPEPEAAPSQTPAAAAPPRRLVRRRDGKILGGVCTGVAAYFGVDPVLVRVGFVLAAVLGGGSGLLVYIVMWLVMPMAPEGEPLPPPAHTDWFDSSSAWRWTAIGLIILAVVLLSHNIWHFHASLFWGLVLLGVGVALWSREFHGHNGNGRSTPTPPPPRPPATGPIVNPPPIPLANPPPAAPTEPISGGATTHVARSTPPAPIPSPAARPPSVLGRLVVGAAALAVGIAVLLDNLGTVHARPRGVIALVLFIVGLGLIVGAWWGRARWLIVPGAVLALLLAGVGVLPTHVRGGAGNVDWAPATLTDLRTQYQHGAGNAVLDLTNLTFDAHPRRVRVDLAFGNLTVLVPENVPVFARASVRGGKLDLFGRENNGFGYVTDERREDGDPKIGLLTLRTDLGFGNTEIRRGRPGDAARYVSSDHVRVDIGPGRVRVNTP